MYTKGLLLLFLVPALVTAFWHPAYFASPLRHRTLLRTKSRCSINTLGTRVNRSLRIDKEEEKSRKKSQKLQRQVASVCHGACEEFSLRPEDVTRKDRHQIVRLSDVIFRCSNCPNTWSTHLGWALIDCIDRRMRRIWTQKCSKCSCSGRIVSVNLDGLRTSVTRAVLTCLEQSDGILTYDSISNANNKDLSHKQHLCEKCGYGEISPCYGGGGASQQVHGLTEDIPLPPHFLHDGWTSWNDVGRLTKRTIRRAAFAKAFHQVKIEIQNHSDLSIDKGYYGGVFEAGSVRKDTQSPYSDVDMVVFVADYRPSMKFINQRLDAILGHLERTFEGNITPTAGGRFSRQFQLRVGHRGQEFEFDFDILLGGRIENCRLAECSVRTRMAWSASTSPFQVEFIRSRVQERRNKKITERARVLREAIISLKHWKHMVRNDCKGAAKPYLPSYLLELLAVASYESATAKQYTIGWLFRDVLHRLGNYTSPDHMVIDFVGKPGCTYTQEELDSGLPEHCTPPSVADPANPTNNLALRPRGRGTHVKNDIPWEYWSKESHKSSSGM